MVDALIYGLIVSQLATFLAAAARALAQFLHLLPADPPGVVRAPWCGLPGGPPRGVAQLGYIS
jgi:hypothetical protein